MKTYIVWGFILGTPPEITMDYDFIEANNQEEAEREFDDSENGWGILGSREWTKEDDERDEPVKFDLW